MDEAGFGFIIVTVGYIVDTDDCTMLKYCDSNDDVDAGVIELGEADADDDVDDDVDEDCVVMEGVGVAEEEEEKEDADIGNILLARLVLRPLRLMLLLLLL